MRLNRSRQQGMILFYTLMLTSMLALLVLTQSQLVLLQLKAANRIQLNRQIFHKLEVQVNQLVAAGSDHWPRECLVTERNPDVVLKFLESKKGCHVKEKGQEYHYIMEDLGLFPCLAVSIDHKVYGTRHWRLTITASGYEAMSLQVRIASASPDSQCENNPVIYVNTGIISWRYGI